MSFLNHIRKVLDDWYTTETKKVNKDPTKDRGYWKEVYTFDVFANEEIDDEMYCGILGGITKDIENKPKEPAMEIIGGNGLEKMIRDKVAKVHKPISTVPYSKIIKEIDGKIVTEILYVEPIAIANSATAYIITTSDLEQNSVDLKIHEPYTLNRLIRVNIHQKP